MRLAFPSQPASMVALLWWDPNRQSMRLRSRMRPQLRTAQSSDLSPLAASSRHRGRNFSDLFPMAVRYELLKISLRQLYACTCGRLEPSVSAARASRPAISISSAMACSNEGLAALAESTPVIMDGIPADRRVVDTWA